MFLLETKPRLRACLPPVLTPAGSWSDKAAHTQKGQPWRTPRSKLDSRCRLPPPAPSTLPSWCAGRCPGAGRCKRKGRPSESHLGCKYTRSNAAPSRVSRRHRMLPLSLPCQPLCYTEPKSKPPSRARMAMAVGTCFTSVTRSTPHKAQDNTTKIAGLSPQAQRASARSPPHTAAFAFCEQTTSVPCRLFCLCRRRRRLLRVVVAFPSFESRAPHDVDCLLFFICASFSFTLCRILLPAVSPAGSLI